MEDGMKFVTNKKENKKKKFLTSKFEKRRS